MKQVRAKVARNDRIGRDFCRMRLAAPYLGRTAKAGQFVEIRCTDGIDPLLRRPLGCHRITPGGIEVLYEIVGKGTELLAGLRAGAELDIIGPLGNGFEPNTAGEAVLVAGGIGVAPLVALAEELAKRQQRTTRVVIGARSAAHVLCEKEFRSFGCSVAVSTEDGSKGHKGLATELLLDLLRGPGPARHAPRAMRYATIYACGPAGMLKAVAEIARSKKAACQVSLEERMACGVGVCLGCPVKVKTPCATRSALCDYKMVCKDGPVFNAEEIVW